MKHTHTTRRNRPACAKTTQPLAPQSLRSNIIEPLESRLLLAGTLAGQVWNDANGDGLRGAEEPALAGITVNLLSSAGETLATFNSADDGTYRFTNLQISKSYLLEFTVPFGWTLSPRDQGTDDTLDSDVDLATARTALFTPTSGQPNGTQDAGLMAVATVRGITYNDLDGDGTRDPGDPGLAGRTIYIDANANGQFDEGETSVQSDPDGGYRLDNLRPGTYRIGQLTPSQWLSTGPAEGYQTITLQPGDWLEGLDLGSQSMLPKAHAYPVGSELQVSQPGEWGTYTSFAPSVAMNAAGESVAVWQVYFYPDHDVCGVYAQRYNAAGAPQGEIINVAQSADDGPMTPAAAIDAAGNVVIVWQDQWHLDARIYLASGEPAGEAFAVAGDEEVLGLMQRPTVAMDPAGDFVVAWQYSSDNLVGPGIYAQRYSLAGERQGDVLPVSDSPEGEQLNPAIAMDRAGNFVVTWQSQTEEGGDGFQVYARRYDAAGAALGERFAASSLNTNFQVEPVVAMDAEGDFVIVWEGYWDEDPYAGDIYAQWFNAIGQAQGPTTLISTTPDADDTSPAVALSGDGNCVIAWQIRTANGFASDVSMRTYDAAGAPQDYEQCVNANIPRVRSLPAVAADADGDFFIVWESGYGGLGTSQPATADADVAADSEDTLVSWVWDNSWQTDRDEGQEIHGRRFWWTADPVVVDGLVWNDVDANGSRDSEEPVLAGLTVNLLSASGDVLTSTLTDENGWYSFNAVRPGSSYAIQVVLPSGMLFTWDQRGVDDAIDSDVDRLTGRSDLFALAAGQLPTRLDAGLIQQSLITGYVYNDRNLSGNKEISDQGLANWIVYLDQNGNNQRDSGEPFAITAEDGSYSIAGLHPGDYRVVLVSQNHWKQTAPSDAVRHVTLSVGWRESDVNFGNCTTIPDTTLITDGSELRVNVGTDLDETVAGVAMDAAGNFVVTFMRTDHRLLEYGVFARRYNSAGQPQDQELEILPMGEDQSGGAIAMDPAGNFVVAWTVWTSQSQQDVYMQRYNAAGVRQGSPIRINSSTSGDQTMPVVRMDRTGNITAFWYDQPSSDTGVTSVFARRFNAAGHPLGDEYRLSTSSGDLPNLHSVAMDSAGNFLIAYSRLETPSTPAGVYLQRYNAAGVPQGSEIFTHAATYRPTVSLADSGEFVFAWDSLTPAVDGLEIYAQRYSAAGVQQGAMFQVNTYTQGFQEDPVIRMDPDGGFVIVWTSAEQDGSGLGIYARRYNAAGVPQGSEFRVNAHTDNTQWEPVLAMDSDGDFVVAWSSYEQDGDEQGVYAQRYQLQKAGPVPEILSVAPDPCANATGQIRIVFNEPVTGFDLADLALTRNGSPCLFTPLQSLTSADGRTWTLNNLTPLTFIEGQYTLSLRAQSAGIVGLSGRAMTIDASESFAVTSTTIQGTPGDDQFEVGFAGDQLYVLVTSGTTRTTYVVPAAGIPVIEIDGGDGNDAIRLPAGMPEGMRLRVSGGAGVNLLTIDGGVVELAPWVNSEASAEQGGDFALVVKGTAQALIDPTCGVAALDIRDEAKVTVQSAGAHPLSLKALSLDSRGTLDLNGNDLVLAAASNADATLFQISKLIGLARNASTGRWTGAGITSSTLRDKPLLGLAMTLRNDTILVKQTWNGDVNLDGKVDLADYFLIDSGFITQKGGYRNGDLNYDGKVDLADYFLVDSAFIKQNSQVWNN